MQSTGGGELLDLVLMVADSAWNAKDWVACKRAYGLAMGLYPANAADAALALSRIGRIALMCGDLNAAIRHFTEAYNINSDAPTSVNLAIAYSRKKEFAHAEKWCNDALLIAPIRAAFVQLAAIHQEQGDYAKAERVVAEALALHSGNPELLYALSLYQLRRGDFENGWRNYEYRQPRLDLCAKLDEYPEWQGEALSGKTILVCGEQGMGDQIMWARYLDPLLDMGGNVILFARPELARLMQMSRVGHNGRFRVLSSDGEIKGLEPDYWVAMGSLAQRFPIDQGRYYICAEADDVGRFRALVPADGNLRVGLCWKGNPRHRYDEYRSMAWADFRPLLDTPGVTFYSLQQGDRESGLVNLIDYCHDMADTAAAIWNLDLVISVDTGVAHLAGALGGPVWILLGEKCADWRWGTQDGATSWYPGACISLGVKPEQIRADLSQAVAVRADGLCRKLKYFDVAFAKGRPVNPIVTRECKYGPMSWYRNDHYIGRALDLYGEYSESEVELFRRILKSGDVVVEAGANIGALTVALADIVGPSGEVSAYEPQPEYQALLKRNIEACGARMPAVACLFALGSEKATLSLPSIPLDRIHAPGWIEDGDAHVVQQYPLDSAAWFSACHLIKIDVDGQELAILDGAEATIARCRPLIYVENDKSHLYPDLIPWLHAHGYRLYQHFAPLFSADNFRKSPVNVFGSIVSAMLLAVPEERKDLHPCDWGLSRILIEKESK